MYLKILPEIFYNTIILSIFEKINKYNQDKIYKVIDIGYTRCCIGSTCESLCQRVAKHFKTQKHQQYLQDNPQE